MERQIYSVFTSGVVSFCLTLLPKSKEMESSIVFDKNVVEFVTVSAEYCSFMEQAEQKERNEFVYVLPRLLSLLYLKALMLPETETDYSMNLEEWVTEQDYDTLRAVIAAKLGSADDYLEVFVEEMKYSDTPVLKTISEDLADIYQALKNFVHSYQSGLNEVMAEAVAVCADGFKTYWGQTLVNTLRAVHSVNNQTDQEGDAGGSNYSEDLLW